MGIDTHWIDENGVDLEAIPDPASRLGWFIVRRAAVYSQLRFIDAAGDAIFNQLQLPTLVDELAQAASEPGLPPAVADHLAAVHALSIKTLGRVHTYLKFIGD